MKIAGIVLIVLQVLSLFPALVAGDNIFGSGGVNLIGRFIFGIVGLMLLFLAKAKQSESKDKTEREDENDERWE